MQATVHFYVHPELHVAKKLSQRQLTQASSDHDHEMKKLKLSRKNNKIVDQQIRSSRIILLGWLVPHPAMYMHKYTFKKLHKTQPLEFHSHAFAFALRTRLTASSVVTLKVRKE